MNEQDLQAKYEQRLLELSLMEKLGGETPSDLVDQAVAKLEASRIQPHKPAARMLTLKGGTYESTGRGTKVALVIGSSAAALLILALSLNAFGVFGGHEPGPGPAGNGQDWIADNTTDVPQTEPPLAIDPMRERLDQLSTQIISIDNASWKLADNDNVMLEQGWFLVQPDAPTVHAGLMMLTPIDGQMLVNIGTSAPAETELDAVCRHLTELGYTIERSDAHPRTDMKCWKCSENCCVYLLSGSAIMDGHFCQCEQTHIIDSKPPGGT